MERVEVKVNACGGDIVRKEGRKEGGQFMVMYNGPEASWSVTGLY